MQIVIDIPEELGIDIHDKFQDFFQRLRVEIKEHLISGTELVCGAYELETIEMFLNAFANSITLSKGHGDLIDRNELKKAYDERITYLYTLNKKDNPSREAKICATNWCVNTIDELPTIIEADNEQNLRMKQESVLDKIEEEIKDTLYIDSLIFTELIDFKNGKIDADDVIEEFNRVTRMEVLRIIDKYKLESEEKE